jgi:long-chain acyl-CoA synthetase
LIEQSCVAGVGHEACHAVLMLSEDVRDKLQDPAVQTRLTKELSELLKSVNQKLVHHEHLQFFAVAKDEWQIENGYLTPTMKIKRGAIEANYSPKLDAWYKSSEAVLWE